MSFAGISICNLQPEDTAQFEFKGKTNLVEGNQVTGKKTGGITEVNSEV